MNRKTVREHISASGGIEQAMRVPKGTLTPKMKRFAEQIALGSTGADAYRKAYSDKGSVDTIGNNASRLKSDTRIKAEIERIEQANELAALHSAAGLKSIVIATLAEIATSTEEKGATRVQAVRAIGQLVGVDAFRETKRVEHIKDSGEIRLQILDQLKTMMLASSDVQDVDADSLLVELTGSNLATEEPHPVPTPADAEWDSAPHIHSIPHTPPPSFSETPPLSSETEDPRGDIFGDGDDVAKV
jgi:phage terminase small subunit